MSLAHILHQAEDIPELLLMVLLAEELPLEAQIALDIVAAPEALVISMIRKAFYPYLEHMPS